MERQMDEQTSENTLKTCWLIICFSVGSHGGQKQRFLHRRNGRTDGRTDRPSYRDAFLTDASKNKMRRKKKKTMRKEKKAKFAFVTGKEKVSISKARN